MVDKPAIVKSAKKNNTKRTRPELSKTKKKQWWKLILNVFIMMLWVGASVIVSQLIIGRLMLWILGQETLIQPVWMAVYSALSYILAMVLVIFVPSKVTIAWRITNEKKNNKKSGGKIAPKIMERKKLGLKGWPTWTDIGLAPVGFIVYLILAAILTALFTVFPWYDAEQVQDVAFNTYVTGFDRILAFVTLVVVAPIAEEVIFRGWLYGKMREKFSEYASNTVGMLLSILLVSLVFGLVHGQWNVGVNVFALSVILCGLREITGTIYAGILLHMLKNGVAFYVLYVLGAG